MRTTASVFFTFAFALAGGFICSRTAMAQSAASCSVDPAQVPDRPIKLDGVVVGKTSQERARASTESIEQKVGLKISPDYADLPRVVVRVVRGPVASETLAAVVDGHIPRSGDHVEILSRYRDPRSRCHFIPWTIGATPALS